MNEGNVIAWVIYDPQSGEIIMQCSSRKEARELSGKDNFGERIAKIAKVVEAH